MVLNILGPTITSTHSVRFFLSRGPAHSYRLDEIISCVRGSDGWNRKSCKQVV